ncbi:MAG: hypothetical protein ABI200_02320, partial [Gaiellales bacterium]
MDEQRRIIVAGGGIGGVEAALTLAIGLPDAKVTLISRGDSIRVLPDLVYVPFGLSVKEIEIPLSRLSEFGIEVIIDDVRQIDAPTRQVLTEAGPLQYDVLLAAPGAQSGEHAGAALRTAADARRVRDQLATLVSEARDGARRSITIDVSAENAWSAPAAEFSVLLGAWLKAVGVADRVEVLFATEDREPFEWFGPEASDIVNEALKRYDIKIASSIPPGHAANLGGDLMVSFGSLEPRTINGLPGRSPDGWYVTDEHNAVDENVYVIGDATKLAYRSAFATAWEARRVLIALGGSHEALGETIGGVPSHAVEFEMDLVDAVMEARIGRADALASPFLGRDADIQLH